MSTAISVALSSVTGEVSSTGDGGDQWVDEPSTPTLYGRTHETLQLLNSYSRVSNDHAYEVVAIHGESGSGKTTLVEILRETVFESNGYYVFGKYGQKNSGVQEPYSAIMAAFSDLCDLIIQSDDFEERRLQIQAALGDDGRLLCKTMSRLSPFLDESVTDDFDIKDESALNKFTIACKTFLHAMSSLERPIVLVLDNIQWMDEGSRHIMSAMLSESSDLKNVLLILIYRDEEQEAALDLLASASKKYSEIYVGSLNVDGIQEMITSRLRLPLSDEVRELSELVHQRTVGNAFYIVGFLEFIYHEGLLDDAGEDSDNPNELKIDVERIRQNTMLVDTVADVLLKKIQRLSGAMQETLKIASMLGYRFDPELVAAVQLDLLHSRKPSEAISTEEDTETLKSVDTAFKKAIQNGFIERTGSGCQFCHDRFQSAFRSTVDSSEVQLIHKLIGEELLLREGGQERYRAALHLNRAVSLFVDEDIDLTRVARINLDASQYCQGKSFFFEAVKVLNTGLDILPEKWEKNYDLSLEMSTMLARMLLCVGDFAGCRRISHEITTRAKTLDDKLDLFTVFSDVCQAQSEFSEGVSFGIKTLNEMGIRVPVKVSIVFLISQLVRVNKMLRGKSDADIMGMPAMDDKLTITAMRILAVMGNAYVILRDDNQGVCCAMLALELCLKGGMSPYSDGAFASYAVMQMGLGKYDRALRFSDLSIKLWWAHKNANKVVNATPFIYATAFISHWNEPLAVVAEKLDTATKISFATGDVQPMLIQALWLRICAGENLNDLVDRFGSLHSRLDDLQQGGNIIWLLPAYQFVLNLSSAEVDTWRGLTELTGEVMNENDYAPRADDSADELLLGDIRRMFNFQLAYHFGYYSRAKSLFEESLPFSLKRPMTFHFHVVQIVFFFGALTYFELARVESSLIHRWQARRCKRNLDNLKIFGRPNLIPLLAILEAEEFASAGRKNLELLEERFENAINATASAGLVHMEALANERAGVAFGRLDQSRKANLYFQRASHLYLHSYGARNKAAWLDEQYQQYSESVDHLPGMDITIPSVDTVS